MSRLRVEWHPLIRFTTPRGVRHAVCDCGAFRGLHHMLKQCSLTDELRKSVPRKASWLLLVHFECEGLQFLVEAGLLTCSIDNLFSPQLPATATDAVSLAAHSSTSGGPQTCSDLNLTHQRSRSSAPVSHTCQRRLWCPCRTDEYTECYRQGACR